MPIDKQLTAKNSESRRRGTGRFVERGDRPNSQRKNPIASNRFEFRDADLVKYESRMVTHFRHRMFPKMVSDIFVRGIFMTIQQGALAPVTNPNVLTVADLCALQLAGVQQIVASASWSESDDDFSVRFYRESEEVPDGGNVPAIAHTAALLDKVLRDHIRLMQADDSLEDAASVCATIALNVETGVFRRAILTP